MPSRPGAWLLLVAALCAVVAALPGDRDRDREDRHLRCYHCSTDHHQPNCDDPFNSTGISVVDCRRHDSGALDPREVPVCKKIKQRINNGDLQTVRSCAFVRPDQPCTTTDQSSYIHEEFCVTCETDLCNAAPAVAAAALLTPALTMLLFV